MSAIGMYPVCPGSNQYVLTTPQFDKVEILTSENKIFTIDVKNKTNKANFLKVKKTKNISFRDGLLFNHNSFRTDNFLVLTADSIPSLLRKKDSADNP